MSKKKVKIQIVSWLNGAVLFEYEAVDNTIAKTVEEAVRNDADLRDSNLTGADLRYANLRDSNLTGADLRYANLRDSNLTGADLRYANLRDSDLRYANLRYANLSDSNLRYANLRDSNLTGADLSDTKNADWAIATTRILPEGDIVGWKKCKNGKLAKLLIPADAKRSHAFGRKCRAEYAEVLEIYNGSRKVKTAVSQYDKDFIYKVGETVKPTESFDEDWTKECSSGVHFFITKEEAIHHEL